MDDQQELQAHLKATKAAKAAARKMAKEWTSVLRKAKLENEALQAEIRQLKSDNTTLGASKAKTKVVSARLKLELDQTRVDFAKEKNELEVAYQQQVDDMFFYDYHCCMKRHDITDDILNIPSNNEDEVMLGERVGQHDVSTMKEGFVAAVDDVLETH